MSVVISILSLVLIPLIFGIPILVAVYVYRDANKRGMNALLWMLIALLTPSLLGLIIYLLVRNNHSDLKCPNCDAPVEESFVMCPNCRTKLRPTCDACSAPVQTTWKVCPHCGTELPAYSMDVTAPVRKKDNTLGKILIAILVIPIAIILLLILFAIPLRFNEKTGFAASSVTSLTMSEFMEDLPEHEQLYYNDLFEMYSTEVDEHKYSVLSYTGDYQNDIYTYQYLIYISGAGEPLDISYHDTREGKIFNKVNYLNFDILCDKIGGEGAIFIYSYEGSEAPPEFIRINYNGEEIELRPNVSVSGPFLPTEANYPSAGIS